MELGLNKNILRNQTSAKAMGDTVIQQLSILLVGTFFGIVLVKSEVVSWFRIQKMFLFEEAYMYLVIASAVIVGALSLYVIKKFQVKTIQHQEVKIKEKKFQKGVIIGGAIFGMGWAITGACPGPIYAQIGSGELIATVTFIAAVMGTYLYAFLQPKLPH